MKPNSDSLLRAAETLRVRPAEAVLLGDSVSDMTAARAAGVAAIGYANKPGKVNLLRDAGADAVIESIEEMTSTLRTLARTVRL